MAEVVPLTVLAYEGPQARAYLARMRRAGWQPERVLLMVLSRHPVTRKPIGGWLPRGLRRLYAEKAQELAQNHWPRRLRKNFPELLESIKQELGRISADAASLIDEMLGRFNYEDYAQRVDRVLVDGLQDPALGAALSSRAPRAVLFTGGGILRANLLDLPGVRYLHVHPGYLPYVRGADGLLWSMLVRGRPAASCFYMTKGIDLGEIIAAEDFPALTFRLAGHLQPDDVMLYRAVFSFYDPVLRAEHLASNVLSTGRDLLQLRTVAQDPSREGVTYHFMHPRLRRRTLDLMFLRG